MKTVLQFRKYLQQLYSRQLLVFVFIFFIIINNTKASNYYWVGGAGDWANLSHWSTTSGGTTLHNEIPTALDDVFFDANSFLGTDETVTMNASVILVHNMSWSGVMYMPTLAVPYSTILSIYGSLTFSPNMILAFDGGINFEATNSGNTITTAGKIFNCTTAYHWINFTGIGGEWTLLDAFTSNGLIDLNYGTLNTNGQTVTTPMFRSQPSPSLPRSLNMGSSVFNLPVAGDWDINPGNMTLNCGTSVINMNGGFGSSNSFRGGAGLTYYDVNFISTAQNTSGSIVSSCTFHDVSFVTTAVINSSNTFHNVIMYGNGIIGGLNVYNDLTLSPGHTYQIFHSSPQTINGNLNATGNCGGLIAINSENPGSTATINHPAGNVNVSFVALRDIIGAGGATFTANNSIDLGNNTGWTITPATAHNLYWIGNSGNWDDGNHWSFTSGGTASGCAPSPIDNIFFDNNSFSIPGQTVTINAAAVYCKDMIWTGVTNNPELAGPLANILKIYGSLRFDPNMSISFTGDIYFESTTTDNTITMAGQVLNDQNNEVDFRGPGGVWTLQDAFSSKAAIVMGAGTLTTNDQTVNIAGFRTIPGWPQAKNLNMGSSVFNVSGPSWTSGSTTINCGTSVINMTGTMYTNLAANFNGGGSTYYDLNFTSTDANAQALIFDDNTFHDVDMVPRAQTGNSNSFHNLTFHNSALIGGNNNFNDLTLAAGFIYTIMPGNIQTITGTLNATGNCTALIEINSFRYGSQAIINHPAGNVIMSYVVLKDINATGGGTFIANNSVDLGNNTGVAINSNGTHNLYWIGNSGNWNDGNHWSLTSGGTPYGCAPTPLDNVFFDANSFSATGQSVRLGLYVAYCRDMNWTGSLYTPGFTDTAQVIKIYGSLTFIPAMDLNIESDVSFEATDGAKTITMGGKVFTARDGWIFFKGIGGEWILQDTFTTRSLIKLNYGILTSNNQVVNAVAFNSNEPPLAPRTLNMGSSVFNMSSVGEPWNINPANMTLNCGVSTINCTSDNVTGNPNFEPFFRGGNGLTYYDVNFPNISPSYGGCIADNNTYHNVSFTTNAYITRNNGFKKLTLYKDANIYNNNIYDTLICTPGYIYTLQSGSNQTINNHWQIQGSCDTFIVLQNNTGGSFADVTKTPGSVTAFNVHIKNIHTNGGAIFNAYNSVDQGGNAGWNFSTLPPLLNPGIISGPSTVCPGATTVVYYISPVAGAIWYEWTVPAGATFTVGQGDTLIIVDFGTATSGNITVQSFNGCNYGTNSSSYAVVLATQITPSVTLSASPGNSVCLGSTVTFTATASGTGGGNVNYDFKINGASIQSSSSNSYSTSGLSNNDIITCDITVAAATCNLTGNATSNAIVMSIGTPSTPTVSITAIPNESICSGETINFTATASNTGAGTVVYDFKINGTSVQVGSSNTYSTTNISNGDAITCDITVSGGTCLLSNTATSNSITITVTPVKTAAITITASPENICQGDIVTFSSSITNGGSSPSYQWQINGNAVTATGPQFTTSELNDGDIVSCSLLSNAACIFNATALSNSILTKETNCECILTIPNAFTPNGDGINDRWVISHENCIKHIGVHVYNRYGSLVYQSNNYQDDWMGTYKLKTCGDGTYYYIVDVIYNNRKKQEFRGNVSILR